MKTVINKKVKTIFNFITAVALACAVMLGGARKAGAVSFSDAGSYTLGEEQKGAVTENGNDNQYYKFTLPSSGNIHITGKAAMEYVYLRIYDESSKELYKNEKHWTNSSEGIQFNESLYFASGTYYLCIGRDGSRYGEFDFKIDFTSSNESFPESNGGSNNTFASAGSVNVDGQVFNAQLAVNDVIDFWKFEMPSSGKVDFKATFYNIEYINWCLCDEKEKELVKSNPHWDSSTKELKLDEALYLTKGTYYIKVEADGSRYGRYDFSLPFTSSNESFAETNGGSNNTLATASDITIGQTYSGHLGINDDTDTYKFTLASSQSVNVKVNSPLEYVYVKLVGSNEKEIWSGNPHKDATLNDISFTRVTTLEAGTYYLVIQKDGNRHGNYTFSVEALTKENCPHESYDSVWHESTYFEKGYREYRCKACGYSYKSDYKDIRKLAQGYLSSFCSGGKASLKLSWSSVSDATGYQIRYCKSSSMKKQVKTLTVKGKAKTVKTIKKLSRRKKYYVQVRAYKKSGKNTVYGKWSAKKMIKTK